MNTRSNHILASLCLLLVCLLSFCPALASDTDEDSGSGLVMFSNGLLSINAKEIRPEDIMKEVGKKCGIKIVVFGEVFSEVPVSLKIVNTPVRKGIERVLRLANIPNFLLHFEDTDNGTRIVELDLIGKKGGEKYLTEGTTSRTKSKAHAGAKKPSRRTRKESLKNKKNNDPNMQENFLNVMDEILNAQLGDGEEPDPEEILRLFKEVIPPEMRDQIPPEVLEELEKLE